MRPEHFELVLVTDEADLDGDVALERGPAVGVVGRVGQHVGLWRLPLFQSEAAQNSLSHGGRGQNLLYGDGSVQWLEAAHIDDDRLWDPGTDENGDVINIIVGGTHGEDLVFLVH